MESQSVHSIERKSTSSAHDGEGQASGEPDVCVAPKQSDFRLVLRSVQVIVRTGKLAYVWQGLGHLPELMRRLKREEETGQPVGDRRGNVPIALVSERQTTHSLWALSRKFIRLLLTTEVRPPDCNVILPSPSTKRPHGLAARLCYC
jgi:hypothetical protein